MNRFDTDDDKGDYGLVLADHMEEAEQEQGPLEEDCHLNDPEQAEISFQQHQYHHHNNRRSMFQDIVTVSPLIERLHTTLLPDDTIELWKDTTTTTTTSTIRLTDSPAVVKFFKFLAVTTLFIVCVYHIVRWLSWEHNDQLSLLDLYMYESVLILQDALVYFVVGRLYKQQGVDHLAWMGWCVAANVFSTLLTRFRFLQHSFTLYEVHCRWPWQLWVFVLLLTPLVVGIILLHVQRAVREQVFFVKLTELLLAVIFFLVPYLPSKYLHIHHWFVGWLIGMHCNFDVWWSRAALAWCWGVYINGIAVYGRDPVLTCGYSYWLSEHMQCPYLDCYTEGIMEQWNNDTTTNPVDPMIPPDWRNCSADSYHP
jgi:hypothetical protein